jgi:hypothetical protein
MDGGDDDGDIGFGVSGLAGDGIRLVAPMADDVYEKSQIPMDPETGVRVAA